MKYKDEKKFKLEGQMRFSILIKIANNTSIASNPTLKYSNRIGIYLALLSLKNNFYPSLYHFR